MSRRKKKGGRILLGILTLIIVVVGVGIWYVTPTKSLDLKYRSIDIKGKIIDMLETRQPQMVLNKDEVAQMSKKNLVKYMSTHDVGVEVTGVDFQMNGEMMTADVNGKWGVLPFGTTLQFHMTSSGNKLILEHQLTKIRSVEVPSSIFKLEPIEISLKDYLPDIVTVKDVDFLEDGMKLTFKIDWLSIPSLW